MHAIDHVELGGHRDPVARSDPHGAHDLTGEPCTVLEDAVPPVVAIVPILAWHPLGTSLHKAETVKIGWAGVLADLPTAAVVDRRSTAPTRTVWPRGALRGGPRLVPVP